MTLKFSKRFARLFSKRKTIKVEEKRVEREPNMNEEERETIGKNNDAVEAKRYTAYIYIYIYT